MAELAIPTTTSGSKQRRTVPWWNNECNKVVQERKKALNNLKKHISPGNIDKLKLAENQCKYTILKAKKTKLDGFL